jgi:hypothetical protein
VLFDGSSIWVSSGPSRLITKLRASDGALLGTFLVGSNPGAGLAFDGANIWCRIASTTRLPKLRGGDGVNLGTFPTGLSPSGVAFGANIWVANNIDGSVTKLRARDGASLGTFPTGHGRKRLRSMAPASGSQMRSTIQRDSGCAGGAPRCWQIPRSSTFPLTFHEAQLSHLMLSIPPAHLKMTAGLIREYPDHFLYGSDQGTTVNWELVRKKLRSLGPAVEGNRPCIDTPSSQRHFQRVAEEHASAGEGASGKG